MTDAATEICLCGIIISPNIAPPMSWSNEELTDFKIPDCDQHENAILYAYTSNVWSRLQS